MTDKHPTDALPMPEPQAQAAEPEVVGYLDEFGNFEHGHRPWMDDEAKRGVKWSAVITLRSYREAIAKKDAALDACVDVDEYELGVLSDLAATLEFRSPTRYKALTKAIAAITQAQGVRKS